MFNIIIFPGWFPSELHPLKANFTKKHIDLISESNNLCVAYAEQSLLLKTKYEIKIDLSNRYPIITCFYKRNNLFIIGKAINLWRSISAYWKAFEIAKRKLGIIDFIHVHVITIEGIIPLYLKKIKKIPYYISEHSTAYVRDRSEYFFMNSIKRIILKNSSGISAVSETLKNAIEKVGGKHANFKIIHNVVDYKVFGYKPKPNQQTINFLHVSRLDEQAKNVIGILKVFDKLYSNYSNIRLNIVGGVDGVVSSSEIFSKELSSKGNIMFYGPKTMLEVVSFFNHADYLVMFSNYETQAVVVMESLFCGVPVITTNLPCLNEYLHKRNSITVNPLDEEGLYNAMELCVRRSYDFWDAKKISDEINKVFGYEKIAQDFQSLYINGFRKLK